MDKSPDAFRTISEAADDLDLPQHVLRFWETRFPQIKPLKRGGGRRYYRPDDVELLRAIKQLLYGEGYTIKGVQKLFKEQGARAVAALRQGEIASRAEEPGAAPPTAAETRDQSAAPLRGDGLPAGPEGFSTADLRALRSALADIAEGERILSLARNA
jgi:DNA-binding transcriptional MerR regulator